APQRPRSSRRAPSLLEVMNALDTVERCSAAGADLASQLTYEQIVYLEATLQGPCDGLPRISTQDLGLLDEGGGGKDGVPSHVITGLPSVRVEVDTMAQGDSAGSSSHSGGGSPALRVPGICTECMICLMNFAVGDMARGLPCRHCFHSSCIDRWLAMRNMCPICKASIPA
ncbi:hypothetical protein CYMTET_12765, partial [Cymbomonas tetramitiformis]